MHPPAHPQPSLADRVHVVLVEPGDSLNVGAVARAMSNLGFAHLHLVAPPRYDPQKAAVAACWGRETLERARVHDSLAAALAPMEHVVGFSARHGRNRPRHLALPQWVAGWAADAPGATALLFGPEDHGLQTHHLDACHALVRIPSSADNPSFNLAQSVLLALYEIDRHTAPAAVEPVRPRADAASFTQLDRLVTDVLRRCRYYGPGTPRPVPRVVQHLLRRIDPDPREMRILLGVFGKIQRALRGRIPVRALPEEDAAAGGEDESA